MNVAPASQFAPVAPEQMAALEVRSGVRVVALLRVQREPGAESGPRA